MKYKAGGMKVFKMTRRDAPTRRNASLHRPSPPFPAPTVRFWDLPSRSPWYFSAWDWGSCLNARSRRTTEPGSLLPTYPQGQSKELRAGREN